MAVCQLRLAELEEAPGRGTKPSIPEAKKERTIHPGDPTAAEPDALKRALDGPLNRCIAGFRYGHLCRGENMPLSHARVRGPSKPRAGW